MTRACHSLSMWYVNAIEWVNSKGCECLAAPLDLSSALPGELFTACVYRRGSAGSLQFVSRVIPSPSPPPTLLGLWQWPLSTPSSTPYGTAAAGAAVRVRGGNGRV